jgi:hypothetical protein
MLDRFSLDHPSLRSAAGTGVSYLLVLGVVFIVLFVVPFLLFVVFG